MAILLEFNQYDVNVANELEGILHGAKKIKAGSNTFEEANTNNNTQPAVLAERQNISSNNNSLLRNEYENDPNNNNNNQIIMGSAKTADTQLPANTNYWYQDADISLLVSLLVHQINGFAPQQRFLLAGKKNAKFADADGKDYFVALTDAVEVESKTIPIIF